MSSLCGHRMRHSQTELNVGCGLLSNPATFDLSDSALLSCFKLGMSAMQGAAPAVEHRSRHRRLSKFTINGHDITRRCADCSGLSGDGTTNQMWQECAIRCLSEMRGMAAAARTGLPS